MGRQQTFATTAESLLFQKLFGPLGNSTMYWVHVSGHICVRDVLILNKQDNVWIFPKRGEGGLPPFFMSIYRVIFFKPKPFWGAKTFDTEVGMVISDQYDCLKIFFLRKRALWDFFHVERRVLYFHIFISIPHPKCENVSKHPKRQKILFFTQWVFMNGGCLLKTRASLLARSYCWHEHLLECNSFYLQKQFGRIRLGYFCFSWQRHLWGGISSCRF